MTSFASGDDPAIPDPGPLWIKSSLSFSNGNCVQVTRLLDGQIGVRDSKNPEGAMLRFSRAEWHAFLDGARRGEFDSLGM